MSRNLSPVFGFAAVVMIVIGIGHSSEGMQSVESSVSTLRVTSGETPVLIDEATGETCPLSLGGSDGATDMDPRTAIGRAICDDLA